MRRFQRKKAELAVISFRRIIFLLILFCMDVISGHAARVVPDDSVLLIPFGQHNTISYHLEYGTYKVVFNTNVKIDKACAFGRGDKGLSSQDTKYQSYTKEPANSSMGKGTEYTIVRKSQTGQTMKQVFIVYPDKDFFIAQLDIAGMVTGCHFMSPLYNAVANMNNTGGNSALKVPFDNDMWVRYKAQKLDTADFDGSEVTAIYNDDNQHGIIIGSLEHEIWKTGIHVHGSNANEFELTAFGGFTDSILTHDKKEHGNVMPVSGECKSPQMLIGYFDDWHSGMELYGKMNLLAEPRFIKSWTSGTPIGWNSWGVLQDKLTLEDAKGVVDFFYDSCKNFRTEDGTLFIDLDSYWDRLVKGGLDGDASELKQFVTYCQKKGFKPGIYWAPFADWGKKGDNKVEGSNYTYRDCWTIVNGKPIDVDGARAMDPTHPATLARIRKYIQFFKRCGFKMIKIDFLGHAALEADYYHNKEVHTGMQAFKVGMEALDKALDNSMLVYAAISPNLATARYVHMRRIACDAFKRIDETAYTLNSTTYGWWQGQMYDFMDADHVVFDDVSDGENRARLASAIVTGSVITGDDYSKNGKWSQTARGLLQNRSLLSLVWNDGKSFRPLVGDTENQAGNLFIKKVGKNYYLAVFNYGEEVLKIQLPLRLECLQHPIAGKYLTSLWDNKIQSDHNYLEIGGKDAGLYEITVP